MALPNPVPDNPLKWNGWKNYTSNNPYERLCLDFESNPSAEQIEENWRQLLVWWQKKLPLKNQPSNPMAQLLRLGLDEAPAKLTEARTLLLDPAKRAEIDSGVLNKAREQALDEFGKFLEFSVTSGSLHAEEEDSLYLTGEKLGLSRQEMEQIIDATLTEKKIKRVPRHLPFTAVASTGTAPAPAAETPTPASAPAPGAQSTPAGEFMRMLWLSGIDELTDDQRDAFCNMGEALGLSGGDAEDVIDEYLEARMRGETGPTPATRLATPATPSTPTAAAPAPAPERRAIPRAPAFVDSPLHRAEEKRKYPPYTNTLGTPMLLIPSGTFRMGSDRAAAAANEQPVSPTNLSAFYLARWPVTNAQYELFDPAHRSKRAPWANDHHPVIYVTAIEAARFCEWLSRRENRRYRLPTEAEWEYAARGFDGRTYPWGEGLAGHCANFADANSRFPWSEPTVNDGFAETCPVGSHPAGASPFGVEEMAGNVWEWCLDCMTLYPGKVRTNPRGPTDGLKRITRGGSWKSRPGSLRASARAFQTPGTFANDIGFRVMSEIARS